MLSLTPHLLALLRPYRIIEPPRTTPPSVGSASHLSDRHTHTHTVHPRVVTKAVSWGGGTTTELRRHWCGTGSALVRHCCGTGAALTTGADRVRNGCGTAAERRRNAGGSAVRRPLKTNAPCEVRTQTRRPMAQPLCAILGARTRDLAVLKLKIKTPSPWKN